jgi:hypothetical protein
LLSSLNLCFLLNTTDQVAQPHKRQVKKVCHCSLICMFLDIKRTLQ